MKKDTKKTSKKVVVMVGGGFDPVHFGHLAHFKKAKKLGDELVVAIDGNDYIIDKKGAVFMPLRDRKAIISEFKCVDRVIVANEDNISEVIRKVRPAIIAKGGDRVDMTGFHPKEIKAIKDVGAKVVFGIGSQLNSSSKMLKRWVDLKLKNKLKI